MKDELVKSAEKLRETIQELSDASEGTALHMAGSIVTLRKWLRAVEAATADEAEAYKFEVNQAIEKLEDMISIQLDGSTRAKEVADFRLSKVVGISSAILQQNAEKNVDPINDPTVRAQVWGLTGGKCAYCQIDLAPDGQGNGETHTFCVEHVVPVSYGGPNNIRNYVPSCKSCNNSKGDRHVLTFIQNNLPTRLNHIGIRLVANGMPERME